MSARAKEARWPLVLFTVLSQAAAGACVARAVAGWGGPPDPIPAIALVLLAVGTAAGLLHLGQLGSVRFALLNIGSSWLSREMLTGLAFAASLVVRIVTKSEAVGIVAAVLGLAFVVSIARVYMIRTVPAWNTWATPAAFLCTTLLLGAATFAITVILTAGRTDPRLKWIVLAIAVAAALELIVARLHLRRLDREGGAAAESAEILRTDYKGKRIWRAVTGALGLAVLITVTWFCNKTCIPAVILGSLFLLASELIGRGLFYASHRRVGL